MVSYGTIVTTTCQECGQVFDVIHFEINPPPIPPPYPVIAIAHDSNDEPGSRLTECPGCDADFGELRYDIINHVVTKGD